MRLARAQRFPEQRLSGARVAFALAHLTGLALLSFVSPGGSWALGAGLAVALLAAVPPPGKGLRADLLTIARLGAGSAATFVALATLFFLPTGAPGAPLAWFGRLVGLAGLLTLTRTPQRLLGGHALLIALALWNAAACDDSSQPHPFGLGLAVLALLFCLRGVLDGHSEDLEQRSARSITTGVAPTPWGLQRIRLPALLVLALALVPLGLGVELPRWPLEATPEAAGAGATPTLEAPGWDLGFAPEVRADEPRGAGVPGDTEILRATVRPDRPVLYLRGAELSRMTPRGCFPPQVEPAPLPVDVLGPRLHVDVELLLEQKRALFVLGRRPEITGVRAQRTAQGFTLAQVAEYPLRYEVDALGFARGERYDPLDPHELPVIEGLPIARPVQDPTLLALPPAIEADAELRELAETVAWGRSPHQRVRNVSRFLQERCTYSLQRRRPRGLTLRRLLRYFLDTKREGVCEEFALAACVLLRRVDVPTRVVTGYRSAERDDEGRFRVRARHAHAWIEVAYEGLGWVPYDPTPPLAPNGASQPRSTPTPTPTAAPARAPAAQTQNPFVSVGRLAQLFGAGVDPGLVLRRAAILFGCALLILFTRRSTQAIQRQQREHQLGRATPELVPIADLRSRLFALLERRGFYLDGAETPREFLERHPQAPPELLEALTLYLPLRFSGRADPAARARLEALIARVEREKKR